MNKVITYLKDPQTVASFQKLCGIVRIDEQNGGHALPANGSTVTTNGDHTPSNGSAIQHGQNGNSSTIRNRVNGHSSNHSHSQIEADCREYSITNWFLYYLFHLGANLGNEIFYITFSPSGFGTSTVTLDVDFVFSGAYSCILVKRWRTFSKFRDQQLHLLFSWRSVIRWNMVCLPRMQWLALAFLLVYSSWPKKDTSWVAYQVLSFIFIFLFI